MEILTSTTADDLSTFDEVSTAYAALEEKQKEAQEEKTANADIESLQALDQGTGRYNILTDYFTRQMAKPETQSQPDSRWKHYDFSKDDEGESSPGKMLNNIQDVCDQIKESAENTEKRVEDLEVKIEDMGVEIHEEIRSSIRATYLIAKANQSSMSLILSMLGEMQQSIGRLGARLDALTPPPADGLSSPIRELLRRAAEGPFGQRAVFEPRVGPAPLPDEGK